MLVQKIEALSLGEIKHCQQAAELALLNMGITFNVYGHERRHRKDLAVRPRPAHRRSRTNGTASSAG